MSAAPGEGLFELLERAAARFGPREAVVDGARRVDYAAVLGRVRALAAGLAELGLEPGERVAALLPNGLELFELYFAAPALGAALVPLNLRLAPVELAAVLDDCEPAVLVVHEAYAALAEAACGTRPIERVQLGPEYEALLASPGGAMTPARADLDALAQLYYTSGTTGRPKGVMLTQRNVLRHAEAAVRELAITTADRWGHFAPMFHLADAWATFALTIAGGAHVMLPSFEARAALDLVERERVTLTNLVPTMLVRLVHEPGLAERELASLRLVLSGGAPISSELVRRTMEAFGCEYAQTYGLTETSPYLTVGLLDEELRALPFEEQLRWRAKTGRPFEAVELRITDEAGREVPRDGRTVGEVRARGETVTPGYWRRPEETAAAFDGEWFLTGDLATVDERGFLNVVDRKKDVIKTGGESVYSTEVEHALASHPAVLECAAFGRPDAEWGERVCAAVVLRGGREASAEELRAHCRERLGAYKVPREIEFVGELPKTGSGKVQKRLLRG